MGFAVVTVEENMLDQRRSICVTKSLRLHIPFGEYKLASNLCRILPHNMQCRENKMEEEKKRNGTG